MRNFLQQITGFTFLVISISCSSGGSQQPGTDFPWPEPGKVHRSVDCKGDTSISYALYIPSQDANPRPADCTGASAPFRHLSKDKALTHYPVMIAFDPHGDGALPVTLYKELAQKYGFILVGSNNSRNGLPGNEISRIVSALNREAHEVYMADSNTLYLLGFSGGARVAAMSAMYEIPVKCVIGCGAGFGTTAQPIRHKFDFYGIVGTADFNMNELLQLNDPLSQAGFRHYIATFPGIHAWPPVAVMHDGFRWVTLNAMKDGILAKDDGFISSVLYDFEDRSRYMIKTNNLLEAADACRMGMSGVESLIPVTRLETLLDSISGTASYTRQMASREKAMQDEESEKQELMTALQAKDLVWWRNKIADYKLPITDFSSAGKRINPEDTLEKRRLLAFLSLYCYMNLQPAMAQQNEPAAIKIIAVYEMCDAVNPEPNYMRAVLLARRSEKIPAVAQLKIAVDKGFSDKQRLMQQSEFVSLQGTAEWIDLMKKIK